MTFHKLIIPITAAIVVTASLSLPVQAAVVSGTYDGNSTLTPTGTPGVFSQSFSGSGTDTAYGPFTLTDQSTLALSAPPNAQISDVTFEIAFAKGALFGSGSGMGNDVAPGVVSATLDLIITGGTGAYVGDTGKVTVTELDTLTGPTTLSVSNGAYTGVLNTAPEPAAWTMLILGLAMIGLVARGRRRAMTIAA